MVTENYALKRIEMLQAELDRLRRMIVKEAGAAPVSLRGIWKGVDFSEEEIDEAIQSWLRE